MLTRIRSGMTYANVMATIAVFLALGGGAYAAIKLPKNSVGAKQLKTNAVRSPEVKDGSLLSKDFKAGQLPQGPRGPKGDKGEQGVQGNQGAPGPGAISFNAQESEFGGFYVQKDVDNVEIDIECTAGGVGYFVRDDNYATPAGIGVVGTEQINSGAPTAVHTGGTAPLQFFASGTVDLDVIASQNTTRKWVHFHLTAVHHGNGTCNWGGLITPPS